MNKKVFLWSRFHHHWNNMVDFMKIYAVNHFHYHHIVLTTKRAVRVINQYVISNGSTLICSILWKYTEVTNIAIVSSSHCWICSDNSTSQASANWLILDVFFCLTGYRLLCQEKCRDEYPSRETTKRSQWTSSEDIVFLILF